MYYCTICRKEYESAVEFCSECGGAVEEITENISDYNTVVPPALPIEQVKRDTISFNTVFGWCWPAVFCKIVGWLILVGTTVLLIVTVGKTFAGVAGNTDLPPDIAMRLAIQGGIPVLVIQRAELLSGAWSVAATAILAMLPRQKSRLKTCIAF